MRTGDVVDIKIDKKKHNYAEAHITRIVSPSPHKANSSVPVVRHMRRV